MKTVTVVDYGIGNLLSVQRALDVAGCVVVRTKDPELIRRADRLIVPGVGAFADCMASLEKFGLVEPIMAFVKSGRPLLGICVGMQMLMESSEEFGDCKGLGLISGAVRRIPNISTDGLKHRIPHIGWNELLLPPSHTDKFWSNSILRNVQPLDAVYFVHSYNCQPEYESDRLADAIYGGHRIAAAVQKDNIVGTQFHPEKSGPVGLGILSTFVTDN